MQVNYAIVFVSDMKRSVAFYRDLLGLKLRFETSHWTEFLTEGATLALHAELEAEPEIQRGNHGIPGTCRPGFRVDDLDAFHATMIERGVPCIQEPRETFGVWIAQYADPDGLVYSVSGQRSDN